jgi:hypothetical protein
VNGRHLIGRFSDGDLRRRLFVAPDFLDHAPLPGQAPGLDGVRLAEGTIVENWEQLNLLTLMQQRGVILAPAAPPTT